MFELFARFADQPLLALLPAVFFGLLVGWTRRKATLAAAIAWISYWLYETGVSTGLLCSGDCAIRADLLLIAPVLLALSLWAVVAAALNLRRS